MCAPELELKPNAHNAKGAVHHSNEVHHPEGSSMVASNKRTRPPLSRAEVLSQSDPETNCLVIIGDGVYDCTNWQNNHPGGHLTIRALCGKDATESFNATHPDFVKDGKLLASFYHADLKDGASTDEPTLAYRELTKKMEEAGMFETDYSFYYKKMALFASMFALVVAGVTMSDDVRVHALAGMLLGLFWQQTAFVGHDLGHSGVTHDRVTDGLLGLFVGNFCGGISMGWWKRSHNVHHIVTNSIDYDPDIQHLPIFAVTPKFLEGPIFSKFYNSYMSLNSGAHVLVGVQHWLYYPVMAFARFNLYAQSIMHSFGVGMYDRSEKVWRRDLQILSLLGFWTWLVALTASLPTWTSRVVFFILAHNVAGVLHVQITLSHFGMPTYEGVTYDDGSNGFVRTQTEGGIDIDCPPWMDWFHGGLQFQVVHHLWPRVPRHNLRKVQALLFSFCREHDIEYHHKTFYDANCLMLSKLKETSSAAKSWSDLFSDSMNLRG